jgi:hypothetical protein
MKWPTLSVLPIILAVGTAGCEISDCPPRGEDSDETEETRDGECVVFKSLSKFTGDQVVNSVAWTSGSNVAIDGVNGKITIIEGQSSTQLSATVTPFVFRANDTETEEARADMERLNVRIEADGAGNPVIQVTRASGSRTTLGGEIIVELPRGFDARLQVTQHNGAIETRYLGIGTDLAIDSNNGRVQVRGAAVTGVDIQAGSGVEFAVGQLPSTGTGRIIASSGDIELSLPASGTYSVMATARGDSVDFGTLPAACTEEVAAENSKTLTCGGGGFNLTVDAQGLLGDVVATVQ